MKSRIEVFSVDICILTYQRPELLEKTLHSIEAQETFPGEIKSRIIIIDNDPQESGKCRVDKFKKKTSLEVIYEVEPTQGISYARNRALLHTKSELIAFLDDDEIASTTWLKEITSTLIKYNADVVFGPVTGILPQNAPQWAKKHPSFNRPRKASGSLVKTGGTGNVIMKKTCLGQPMQLFNNDYALTGGEDTEFFFRLNASGKKMIWCDTAEVFESVPDSRTTIKWVTQRGFRSGQSYYRAFIKNSSISKKIIWATKKIAQTVFTMASLPIVAACSPSNGVKALTKLSSAIGQFSAALGENFAFNEYANKSPHKQKQI